MKNWTHLIIINYNLLILNFNIDKQIIIITYFIKILRIIVEIKVLVILEKTLNLWYLLIIKFN